MKNYIKPVLLGIMIMCVLIISGCGEEKKYNETKNEVVQMMQEANNIDYQKVKEKGLYTKEEYQQELDNINQAIEEHKQVEEKIYVKLDEMAELSKSETKLNNDLLQLKKEFETQNKRWYGGINESKAITRMGLNTTMFSKIKP